MNRRDFLQSAASSAAVSAAVVNVLSAQEQAPSASVPESAPNSVQAPASAVPQNSVQTQTSAVPQVFRRPFKGGLSLPSLGYGIFRMPTDPDLSQKLVDSAMEAGVNYFDTAYTYLGGHAEELCARVLSKYPRESYFFATKMPPFMAKNEADLSRIFDDQLRKSRVEYFDFYLCHNLQINSWASAKQIGMVSFLQKKKEEGKIRNLGFSFHDVPELLAEIADFHPWDFAMIQLNYFDWKPYRSGEQYETLRKRNIPIWVMEPLRGGLLTDLGEAGNAVFKKADPEASIASWSFRFAASLPGVVTVLSGMKCMEHLQDNIKTFSSFRPLSDADRKVIQAALEAYGSSGNIPCTDCKYCTPCPLEIDIPSVFSVYNYYRRTINEHQRTPGALQMEKDVLRQAAQCVSCKQCLPKCPQKIDIPSMHRQVVASGMKREV